MKLRLKEIYLDNPTTDKTITLKVGKLNGKRFQKVVELDSQFRNVKKEANLLFLMAQQSKDKLMEQFENNKDLDAFKGIIDGIIKGDISYDEVVSLLEAGNTDIFKNNLIRRIEIIKAMIDQTNLTDEQVELVISDPNSDFWQFQDINYLVEISNSFREQIYQ